VPEQWNRMSCLNKRCPNAWIVKSCVMLECKLSLCLNNDVKLMLNTRCPCDWTMTYNLCLNTRCHCAWTMIYKLCLDTRCACAWTMTYKLCLDTSVLLPEQWRIIYAWIQDVPVTEQWHMLCLNGSCVFAKAELLNMRCLRSKLSGNCRVSNRNETFRPGTI
jgi:hypothetical protein